MPDSSKITEIQGWISHCLSSTTDEPIFERLALRMQTHYEQSCTSIAQLRKRCTKTKGDYFEHLAWLYFQHTRDADVKNVWMLSDLPDDIRTRLSLTRNDVGIDLVLELRNGQYSAVQCKYRYRSPVAITTAHNMAQSGSNKKLLVTWKQLSTFYALCQRTGPWQHWIVFTNCDFVSRKGHKCSSDRTIAWRRLCALPKSEWMKMVNWQGQVLGANAESKRSYNNNGDDEKKTSDLQSQKTNLSLEQLRQHRLAFFDKEKLAEQNKHTTKV
jgi:hypothetical protein